jgi:hypothetical protein
VDVATLLASSVIAAVVAGVFSYITQNRLLERKAEIDYKLPARQRLYEALGPLRLQFLFSARDIVGRVSNHPGTRWNMDPSEYYASSFIWRLLRALALGQLIERQMTVADFSVDPASLDLLRFKEAMEEMLTGGEVLMGHPGADWATQSQHLFGDNLQMAAATLLGPTDGGDRVMDFARFAQAFPKPLQEPALADLARIFERCGRGGTLLDNPIFWLRVVGYSYVCQRLTVEHGAELGLRQRPFSVEQLLAGVKDEHISSRAAKYQATFDSIIENAL